MYYEFFGLRDAPFKFQASDTLFLSRAHSEALGALEWAFLEPSGLTLLVGEVGTGKSMLIHSLIGRIKNDDIRIAQIANPTMSFEQMLIVILQQLKLNPIGKDKLSCLQALKTFVSDPAGTSKVILIFDEAQGLSDEVLEQIRLLSNTRPPEQQKLQIILVGQPELAQRLKAPKLRALNQRIGARALLRPLRGEEISNYIGFLLEAQGGRREMFSREALKQVAVLSGGFPRKINNICHNAFLNAYLDRSPVVSARHVRAAHTEIENMLQDSREHIGNESRHGILNWIPGSRAVKTGAALALAVVAVAMVIEFGNSNDSPRNYHNAHQAAAYGPNHSPHQVAQSQIAIQAPKQVPARINAVDPAPLHQAQTANVASSRPANAAQSSGYSARQAVASASAPVVRPSLAPGNSRLASTRSPALPRSTASSRSVNASATSYAASAQAPSTLDYRQKRRLAYEIRRAENSFESGRYLNSIYHSKRALLIDPGNNEMRSIYQRAQAAQYGRGEASDEEETAVASAPAAATASSAYQSAPAPAPSSSAVPQSAAASTGSGTASARRPESFTEMAHSEISEGDTSMRAGDYRKALIKFLTAETLDPNVDVSDRISRARQELGEPDRFDYNTDTGTLSGPGSDR